MGNEIEEIYNQNKKAIYNFFYKSTFNSHISEELAQETFLKAFRHLGSFRGESSIKTWLFAIARNTYISYIRKYGNTGEENIEDHEVASSIDSFSNSDERMLVRQVLCMLSEEDRTLILLRDMNGLTYLEIATIMDYTEGKVKIGLHRARKKFREFYSKECGEE